MRILITGGKGQIGHDLTRVLESNHQVKALGRSELDITQEAAIATAIEAWRPDYLINAAAFTRVDACETDQDLAWRVNATAPGLLAAACLIRKLPLLQLSTDYVFDGRRRVPDPYYENDIPEPLSHYGKSKLEGELRAQSNTGRALILRTSWVYGSSGANFLKSILRAALQNKALRVVNDQFGSPTWSYRIAQQARRLIQDNASGLFHATAEGYASWFEVAEEFFNLMELQVDLQPCSTAEYPTPARRPANSILENRGLKNLGINEMRDWREDLAEFVHGFREQLLKEAKQP